MVIISLFAILVFLFWQYVIELEQMQTRSEIISIKYILVYLHSTNSNIVLRHFTKNTSL